MSAHTFGPWVAERDPSHFDTLSTVVAGAKRKSKGIDRQMIVQVGGWADWREQEANTRLIAAAPELLAACKEAIAELDDCCAVPSDDWDFYEKLRRAIAKADGLA